MISLSDDIQIEKFMHSRKMVQHWIFALFWGPVHATGVDGVVDGYPMAFLASFPGPQIGLGTRLRPSPFFECLPLTHAHN